MITIHTVCMGVVRLKKTKILGCAVAIALATTVGITSDVYAEEHDPSVAITATALPTEEPKQVAEKGRKEKVVLCSCDYMKCVCGITDQEVVEQKPTMKDKVAAIMNERKLQEQEQVAQPVYAKNGVKKGNLYIPKDTVVMLKLLDTLHSKKVKSGASFRLEMVDDLVVNGVVVIPKGQEVLGKVLRAEKSGGGGSGGRLELNIPYLETLNGVQVPVDGYILNKGKNDGGAIAVFAVVSMVGSLFMKGKNVEYVSGQLFNVTVNKDTDLEATPDNLAEVMSVDKTRMQNLVVKVAE